MKKNVVWNILLVIGVCPFVLPILIGFYKINTESWAMGDWLIMYSFIYWPTYLVGLVLLAVSIGKLWLGKR